MLSSTTESDIAELANRYGQPLRVAVELAGAPFDPIAKTDRYGEVCMVVRRPSGKLLTAIKTFYPPGAFRLLTGGVSHGERIEAALWREVAEETGLAVEVRRFLAVIEYHQRGAGGGSRESAEDVADAQLPTPGSHAFATFAFLLDEVGGTLAVSDPSERIGAFREIAVDELPALAATLKQVPDEVDREIGGSWRDWGEFRAVVHGVVFDALAGYS
jgi:NAD+ diphosphatase